MSTQRKTEFIEESISEDAVHDFLAANPDFFENNPDLLSALRLPHATGGAVSLVERQVSVLRQRDVKLERQLKELIQVARENEVLSAKIHHLSLQLLGAPDLASTIRRIEEAVRAGFSADEAVLVLFADADAFDDIDAGRFFRVLPRDDESLKPFATFLSGNGPRCGQVRDAQKNFLFAGEADSVGSLALIPLGDKANLGFLAIGSTDAERFHPGMSIDFLARVGELVAAALRRF